MLDDLANSDNQRLLIEFPDHIQVDIKREDLLHAQISGNKFRKLKYNLVKARQLNQRTLLTFGGAYSNHIAAVAAAAHEFDFNSIGIIRGEELADKIDQNPTLHKAQQHGMQLHFVSRADYRRKTESEFIQQLIEQYGEFYLIPEGGSNHLAVQGCAEILTTHDRQQFDYVCCAVGTGGTLAGIIESSAPSQTVLGFAALKGDFLQAEIQQWTAKTNWRLISDYHCGGYAKTTPALLHFIQQFYQRTGIPLEPIYTGKLMFGLMDLIQRGHFAPHSRILVIHTGGLQGNLSPRFSIFN
jgi:1-aminocyclopropane-1-carboxylate deaminase